jgi:hypothetical protein
MKLNLQIATIILLCFVCAGCLITHESMLGEPEYAQYVGAKFQFHNDNFISQSDNVLTIYEPIPEGHPNFKMCMAPTIESFKNGSWDPAQYKCDRKPIAILPKDSIVEITDIVKQTHIEVGITYSTYGRILNRPEFSGQRVRLDAVANDSQYPTDLRGASPIN